MHIMILCKNGKWVVRKKCDIRDVSEHVNGSTIIHFNGSRNTPLIVLGTVPEFFHSYLNRETTTIH